MEYLLFTVGALLILGSLFLTYRVENDQDGYYIESELLSEIREVKQDVEESFNSQRFDQMLEAERDNGKLTKEVKALQQMTGQLETKLDNISNKLSKLEGRVTNLNTNNPQPKQEKSTTGEAFKPEKYQEIKELVDEGLSLAEIARELDMGNREVDLIWKLNTRGEE